MNPARREELQRQARRLRGLDRILLVGSAGAGKSTLARQLGPALGLPVVHLDREFWRPGWVETPSEEWELRVDELVNQPRWLMDGNYSRTFEPRVVRAQAVVFLDFPRGLCIRRVLGRTLKHFGRSRPDLREGCPERIDREYWGFMLWIWNYPRRSRPRILEFMEQYREGREMLYLSGPAELDLLRDALLAADAG